jgi:eukaryotic-like serine/threonine-protein kinase
MSDASDPKGCPSPDELRDYGQGRLSDSRSDEIALHLENGCAACDARIATVEAEDDDLVDSLRRTGVEPVPKSALERLRAALSDVVGTRLAEAVGLGLLAGEGGRIQIEEGQPVRFGGNGRISIAVDLEIGRPVALKQPLRSPQEDAGRQEQILREARITGSLEHRGIVPIHGLGLDTQGHPCFAMRLIHGVTLKTVIRRFHAGESLETILERGAPIDELGQPLVESPSSQGTAPADPARIARDLRELFRRFRDVCEVLTYAHNRQVVHLDVKPSNIMLGRYGETFVLDWGHACRTEGPGPERFPPGTAGYRSPEQATGRLEQLGPACDVYSLGATLRHLLTGQVLDEGAVRAPLSPEEIGFPRDVLPNDPRPLSVIVNRAMAAEARARYSSPSELADALDRWLADEAVPGWREPMTIRTRRWLRRHRTLATTTMALVVLSLAGLTGFATVLSGKNRELDSRNQELGRQRQAAEDQMNRAVAAETVARDEEARTRKSEAETRAVLDFLRTKVLAAARPKEQAGGLGIQATVRAAVDAAEPGIEKAFADQPMVEASIRETLGESYRYLGEPAVAIRQCERALALRRQAGLGPDDPELLGSMEHLADAYLNAGRFADSVPLYDETLKWRRATVGPDHIETLTVMHNLAQGYRFAGRLADAVSLHEETLRRRRATLGPDHLHTTISMNNLAGAYEEAGRLSEAVPLYEEALKRQRATIGTDHPDTLTSMNNLAEAYHRVGRLADSIALHKEELERSKSILGPDHPETLTSMNNLAMAYRADGRLRDALPLLEEVLKRIRATLDADHPHTLGSMHNLALAYRDAGRINDALPLFEETLKRVRATLGPRHPHTLLTIEGLASCYQRAGRLDDALRLYEEALQGYKVTFGPDHISTLNFTNVLADIYRDAGRLADVVRLRKEVVEGYKTQFGAEHPDTLQTMNNLARAYLAIQPAEAERPLRQALAIREKKQMDDWPCFENRSLLGTSLLAQKKYADAEPLLLAGYEGLKAREARIPPPAEKRIGEAGSRIIALYDAWGKKDKADEWRVKLRPTKTEQERSELDRGFPADPFAP